MAQLLATVQEAIIAPLVWLSPLKWIIVYPGETGIRFNRGVPGSMLHTGWHFATCCQSLKKMHTRNVVLSTDSINLLTNDGVPLEVDAIITYRVHDLAAYLASAEEPAQHLVALVEAALRSIASQVPFAHVAAHSKDIEETAVKEAAVFGGGVKIKQIRFQNVKHTDPYARMTCSLAATSTTLTEACERMAKDLGLPADKVLMALSPYIQPVMSLPTASGIAPLEVLEEEPAEYS